MVKRTIKSYEHRPKFELYDLEHDPDEAHNLVADENHHEVLIELQRKLAAFQQRTGDPWILKWQRE